jgi:hypothetical protein
LEFVNNFDGTANVESERAEVGLDVNLTLLGDLVFCDYIEVCE